jgi:hypothetical protein
MSSLEQMRRQIIDAEQVLKCLDAEMEKIEFDPLTLASVEVALATVPRVIETLLAGFGSNPILSPLAEQLKMQYLQWIADQVVAARIAS